MTHEPRRPWVIIGHGRMGHLVEAMAAVAGREVAAIPSRSPTASPAELAGSLDSAVVWLTVPDDQIARVAAQVAPFVGSRTLLLHCSGSLSSEALRVAGCDAMLGSLHPLLAISDTATALARVGEVVWSYEGDDEGLAFARSLLRHWGTSPVEVRSDSKTLYHAAAVMAAGHVVALLDSAFEVMQRAGVSRDEAKAMLLPLAESSLANLRAQSARKALTGPVARGDSETVARHVRALRDSDTGAESDAARVYEVLSARSQLVMGSDNGD